VYKLLLTVALRSCIVAVFAITLQAQEQAAPKLTEEQERDLERHLKGFTDPVAREKRRADLLKIRQEQLEAKPPTYAAFLAASPQHQRHIINEHASVLRCALENPEKFNFKMFRDMAVCAPATKGAGVAWLMTHRPH
jgi:hypothetical protein